MLTTLSRALVSLLIASALSGCGGGNVEPVGASSTAGSDAHATSDAIVPQSSETTTDEASPSATPDQAQCERDIASMMDLDIDEQSKADNIDSIRIDCDMPPLQDTPFWQEAWRIHLEKAAQAK